MNFCLSDLVPPLRWSDANGFSQLRDLPGLPDAWWRAVPISQVFSVLGPDALGELLTELAMEHWPAAATGDILPALHVMDPEEADEPQVSIALDRVGSWFGLLSLTGRELTDQPFIRARPVLTALFTAVFLRLTPTGNPNAHTGEHPAQSSLQVSQPPIQPVQPPPQAERSTPAGAARQPVGGPGADAPPAEQASAPAEPLPVRPLPPLPKRRPASFNSSDPLGLAAARMAEAALNQRAAKEYASGGHEGGSGRGRPSMFTPPPRSDRPFPAPEAPAFAPESPGPLDDGPGFASAAPGQESPADRDGARDPEVTETPAAQAVAEDGEAPADADAVPATAESQADTGAEEEGTGRTERDIPALIDAAFADLDDKTWAVAQNHVFTGSPAAPEELAKLFAVTPEEIVALEEGLRARLAEWLESEDATLYTQHVEKLPGTLGIAAPTSRLMAAADWHTRELRSLDVPAWQFVLATLPGYTLQEDWLVAGDITELRDQTCGLILNADRPPTVARALELVSTLGIHPEVAKEWLEDVPQLRIQTTKKSKGSATPAEADQADGPSDPEGPPSTPNGQLKDVSMTRRCFRHPDGLWWLRIDVAPEQLAGGECPLPSGFAAYLGMTPGGSHTVTSTAGDITLSWQAGPVIDSLGPLLHELGAQTGTHLFLTVAEEDQVLRARLVPAPAGDLDKSVLALRLAGHTAGDDAEPLEETIRVLATRIGMTGPVGLPELMNRLRERGDRDLLSLMV